MCKSKPKRNIVFNICLPASGTLIYILIIVGNSTLTISRFLKAGQEIDRVNRHAQIRLQGTEIENLGVFNIRMSE